MTTTSETDPGGQAGLAQRVARLLRHEVGDLLQTVYSTTAILAERLPGELAQERRLLSDLKGRAELCKLELDAVVDLVCDFQPRAGRVDVAAILASVVAQVRRRYPSLLISLDGETCLAIEGDGQALSGSLGFLLLAVAQAARSLVGVRLARDESRAACTLERDGYPVGPDQLAWLREPFATTQQALLGLALALSRRTIEPCGGSLAVLPREGGGLCVQLSFPVLDA